MPISRFDSTARRTELHDYIIDENRTTIWSIDAGKESHEGTFACAIFHREYRRFAQPQIQHKYRCRHELLQTAFM
jgi:hypothetical protein